MSFDVYQTVTDKIVAALETAQKWQKPWTRAFTGDDGASLRRPVNAISKKAYQGINVPLLWSARRSQAQWATYKQWQSIGAQVRKGERASLIVFWKPIEAGSNEGDGASEEHQTRRHLIARAYSVFNAEQVDGFADAPLPPSPSFDPVTQA